MSILHDCYGMPGTIARAMRPRSTGPFRLPIADCRFSIARRDGTSCRISIANRKSKTGNSLLLVLLFALRSDLSEPRKILGFDLRSRTVLPADGVINFLAMDADRLGGIDPQTHLVAADVN